MNEMFTHLIQLLDQQLALLHPIEADHDHTGQGNPENKEPGKLLLSRGCSLFNEDFT